MNTQDEARSEGGSGGTGAGPRKVRADVVRNRARILDVAERHFQAHGVSTSLEAVAKDAGLGPATLYRHFPTREALLAALLQLRRQALAERERSIDALPDAAEALRVWLTELEDYFSSYGGLSQPLTQAAQETQTQNPLANSCQALIATTQKYLRAAQREGQARRDLEGLDLFLAVSAVAWARSAVGVRAESLARLRDIVSAGYRHE